MPQTETINLPNHVIDSDWKDDINFEEMTFVPKKQTEASPEAIKKIKAFQEKLAFNGLKRIRQEMKVA